MTPWWATGTWQFVKRRLNKDSRVFEWGSGGSTQCLDKICHVISIENDITWYKKLSPKFQKPVVFYVPHSGETELDPSDPGSFTSGAKFFPQKNFESYVKTIDKLENPFDLIVVDGRARASCVRRALDKIKSGGMLLLDDCWRPRYQKAIAEIPKEWKRHQFKSEKDVHTTSVWIKP